MASRGRRRNRAVGVAGASLVLSTGLFGAYLGNPRLPRAYATAGNCTTAAGNSGTDTIVSDITEFTYALTNANAALCDDITLAAGTFNLSDSAMSSMVQTRMFWSLTYHYVTITSSVTIHGASGTQTSIITGGGASSHHTDMYFRAAMNDGRVELQDLSVNHAGIEMFDTNYDHSSTLSIDHVDFNHNTQVQGAVSAKYLHDVSVDNSTFSYNSSSSFSEPGSQAYIGGAAVTGNDAYAMTITDTTFAHNTAERFGGAVYGANDVTVSGGSFSHNQAGTNGGAIFTYGQLTVSGTSFSHNSASSIGGAIYAKSTTTISDSTFSYNSAGDLGGAIKTSGLGSSQISTSTLSHNSAAFGGGLWSNQSDVTISDSVVDHNTATDNGGGAFLIPRLDPSTIAVSGSTFSDNSAVGPGWTTGGALYWEGDNGPTTASVSLVNSTFSGNYEHSTGGYDGAAAITFDSGDPLVTMDSLTFSGNHGKYLNHLYGHGHLFNSVFDGNTVTGAAQNWIEGSGVAWTGDHLFEESGTPFMLSSVVPWTDTSPLTGASGSALLGALGTNAGGSTQTMLPGAGSPLIGAGSTSQMHDQNGTVRSGAATIGAVHVSPSASYTITYNGNSNTSGSVPSATTGSGSVTLASNTGSLARTGYTFAGWNTLANGTGTSYAAGAAYMLNASVTLYAQWTANGGGGGGGAGSSGSSTESTSSTPVVTRRPVVGAVPLGTASLPTAGVAPGSSFLLVDGVPRAVTVKPDAPVTSQAKGLVATGDGFTLSLEGVDDRGRPLGVTNEAALVLRRDNSALVEGRGFAPDSDVQVYVFSQARLLGTVHTDSSGAFSGLVQVPGDLELGHHTLQVDALHADGTVRSLSLGVVLQAPQVTGAQRVARARVEFDAGSARLTARAKKQLTSLARRAGATASAGMVVGYVQRDGNYATNQRLSAQRARAVARFLHRHGVKATLVTRGNGALSGNDTARKAVVTLRYTG